MGLALSFVAASVAQYVLAQVGWLYRYEAYLILFGCLLILTGGFFPGLVQWFGTGHARLKPWVLAGLGVVGVAAAAIFGYRAIHALDDIVYATRITYNEYYQMARFIDQYYPASTIVVNDIGEIGYQTDARLLDLFALANREPLAAQRNGTFNTGFIDRWTQSEGGQIVIIHDMYYRGDSRLPVGWTQVGTWQVYNHFFDADAIISFYAAIPAEAHELAEHFRSFLPRLAPEVKAVQLVEP